MTDLALPHGLRFEDLYDEAGLARLDRLFLAELQQRAPDLAEQLKAGRAAPEELGRKEESDLLIAAAPHLEDFLSELFQIRAPLAELAADHHALAPLYNCKRLFVQRQALKAHKLEEVEGLDPAPLEAELERRIGAPLTDLAFARATLAWMDQEAA